MMTIDLEKKLIKQNQRVLDRETAVLSQQEKLDQEINKLLQGADEQYQQELMKDLGFNYKLEEAQKLQAERKQFAHLPQERIFSREAIKSLCIKYNLRFLATSLYKGQLDPQIGQKVEAFRKLQPVPETIDNIRKKSDAARDAYMTNSNPALEETLRKGYTDYYVAWVGVTYRVDGHQDAEYMICAPAEAFNLQPRPKDPLLFASLGNGKYYLIHKWGDDLSALRRFKKFTYKTYRPFLGTVMIGVFSRLISVFHHQAFLCALFVLLTWAALMGVVAWIVSNVSGDSGSLFTTEDNWNSPYKA